MRALLIFYLVQHWMFSDSEAGIIYGAYTALVYITPVIGGYLADRYLGQRKAVAFGALLLTFGHFLMAFEGVFYLAKQSFYTASAESRPL
jgi:POT family proton-dependent oligopeptide transporter